MRVSAIILLALLSFTASAQDDRLTLLDIYDLEFVSSPKISPDGNKILYVRNFKDVMTDKNLSNIWVINFDGSGNQPITTGNQRDWNPQWTPDGKRIIYHSNKDGKRRYLAGFHVDAVDLSISRI